MKSKRTKKALLASVLTLLLCFAMLLGSTFAWFTDEAVASVNTIQAGNLKIEMLDEESNSLEGQTLAWQKATGHENEAILWEPGVTYNLQPVKIKNNGDLALSYRIEITGLNQNKLNEVLEWNIDKAPTDNMLRAGEESVINISAHMSEDAGNEYMGLSISNIGITVYASQAPYEYDSTTNEYDKYAYCDIRDYESINKAIGAGFDTLMFDKEVTVDVYEEGGDGWSALKFNKTKQPNMADQIILDGKDGSKVESNRFVIWAGEGADITIKGGTYETTGDTHLIYVNMGGKVTIEGGTFIKAPGDLMFNMANYDGKNGQIIIKGGLYNVDPSTQIAYNDRWNGTVGIKIEDGYKVVEVDVDGTTWYQVVAE